MTAKKRVSYNEKIQMEAELFHKTIIQSLIHKNKRFTVEHKTFEDQELLDYVKNFSGKLGRTPNQDEIIGGYYIASRFGSWEHVLAEAKLPYPEEKSPPMRKRLIYREEAKLLQKEQKKLRDEKKKQRREKLEQTKKEKTEENLNKIQKDREWGKLHEKDTDEELITYVKCIAERLGYTPVSKEVPGAAYIIERIGSWALVLTVAGLPLPKGMKEVNPKTLKEYRKRIQIKENNL